MRLTKKQLKFLEKWRENMKKPVRPDPAFEAFLRQEREEIDEILASLEPTEPDE